MACTLRLNDIEYGMVAAEGDPDIAQFVGCREGMRIDNEGRVVDGGRYVAGSNHGWQMLAAVRGVQIYARLARSADERRAVPNVQRPRYG
jgi:hypothetical protein